MAWTCSGNSNAALVKNLVNKGLIRSDRVRHAMLAVDRAHFAQTEPYRDAPQCIGHAATISAPHMHAAACEALLPFLHPTARILDIGSGSGYLTNVLARLIGPEGRVVGLDHIRDLVSLATDNTAKSLQGRTDLESGRIAFLVGDGRKGLVDETDFPGWDAIHVGAAAVEVHEILIQQLGRPGRLFIPVGQDIQHIWIIDKTIDGSISRKKDIGVRYVPLTDAP